MTAHGMNSPDDLRIWRSVRGIISVNLDGIHGTVGDARETLRDLVNELLESSPPLSSFVRPCEVDGGNGHITERQFLSFAVEYLEMEHQDGVALHPSHRVRLQRILDGDPLPDDTPSAGFSAIPADARDRGES